MVFDRRFVRTPLYQEFNRWSTNARTLDVRDVWDVCLDSECSRYFVSSIIVCEIPRVRRQIKKSYDVDRLIYRSSRRQERLLIRGRPPKRGICEFANHDGHGDSDEYVSIVRYDT